MRDREVIEREMYRAREDLEQSIAELKHVVQEKVDVKARARVAVGKAEAKAYEMYERGKESALHYASLGKDGIRDVALKAKERPEITAAFIAGAIAAGVVVYVGFRRNWW